MSSVYTEKIVEHYKNPKNYGRIDGAHAVAKEANDACGDEVSIYLCFDDSGRISNVSFEGNSCILCKASASMLSEYVKGKTTEEVQKMGAREVIELLGLPDLRRSRLSCALLPLETIKSALKKFKAK